MQAIALVSTGRGVAESDFYLASYFTMYSKSPDVGLHDAVMRCKFRSNERMRRIKFGGTQQKKKKARRKKAPFVFTACPEGNQK